ncbi:AraC family transcriptional regulator [Pulveribacter sp.]|uniref:AraC family transcriptional regulator n=1 Tax=Pulveribacter sp. TaxID=2678893 RepID=UPI0028ACE536|nr:AraC family transcriptional regulator [Pulveribacter sp.]
MPPDHPAHRAAEMLHTRYSTSHTCGARRFEGWREAMGALIDVHPCGSAEAFVGSVSAYAVPLATGAEARIVFSDCRSAAITLDRSAARIARDGLGHYAFQVLCQGGASHQRLRGRECHTEAGGLVALDMRQPFHIRRADYHALALFVPRCAVEAQVPDPELLHGRTVPAHSPLVGLAREYLQALAGRAGSLAPHQLQAALQAALQLLLAALDCGREEGGAHRQAALLDKARACVDQHLEQHGLDADFLAARLCVSRSALYRLFAPYGGVMAYLRARRLRHALVALQRGDDRTVTTLAHDLGFGSASDFSRAFRRRYGISPSRLHAGGPAGRAVSPFPYAAVMRPLATVAAS